MKKLSVFTFFFPLFVITLVFISCEVDENPVKTFEEAIERIPDVQPIQGAENATVNVRNDRDRSYFKVSIENTSGLNGEYNAWCVQMDISLQRGVEHSGTRLYSTDSDKVFNQLSYIVNRRNRYENELEGLSWREIQTAMWVILETRDYNLAEIADRLPSSVEGYNESYVNEILNDVKTNGGDFELGPTDTRLIYYEVDNNQDGVIEETAWSWVGPHEENSNSFRFHNIGGNWGWVTYYWFYDDDENEFTVDNPLEGGMYAGCGFGTLENPEPDDLDNCIFVGYVNMWHENNTLRIKISTNISDDNWTMVNVQAYVGTELPDKVAPGSFEYKQENLDNVLEVNFSITDFNLEDLKPDPPVKPEDKEWEDAPLYIVVHADVEFEE